MLVSGQTLGCKEARAAGALPPGDEGPRGSRPPGASSFPARRPSWDPGGGASFRGQAVCMGRSARGHPKTEPTPPPREVWPLHRPNVLRGPTGRRAWGRVPFVRRGTGAPQFITTTPRRACCQSACCGWLDCSPLCEPKAFLWLLFSHADSLDKSLFARPSYPHRNKKLKLKKKLNLIWLSLNCTQNNFLKRRQAVPNYSQTLLYHKHEDDPLL